jgi:hypothetical protein
VTSILKGQSGLASCPFTDVCFVTSSISIRKSFIGDISVFEFFCMADWKFVTDFYLYFGKTFSSLKGNIKEYKLEKIDHKKHMNSITIMIRIAS